MASVINTNVASLVAQRNLSGAQSAMTTSVERLSSGLRINRAKDDAAGLGISEKLQSQVKTLNMSVRNANDAISIVQTAEGGLSEISTMMQRMKELATQGYNASLNTDQRNSVGQEMKQLQDEITATVDRTTFNGIKLLDGSAGKLEFQTGSDETKDITTIDLTNTKATAKDLSIDTDLSSGKGISDFATLNTAIEKAITTVSTFRGDLGSQQNRLDHTIRNLQTNAENISASRSRIVDTDYASETATMTRNQIQQQAATAMLSQANQMPNVVLSLLK